jgi:hypothetical protein
MIRLDTWDDYSGLGFTKGFTVRTGWFRVTGTIRFATSSYYMGEAKWRDRFGQRSFRYNTKSSTQWFIKTVRSDVEMLESEHWFLKRTGRKIRLMPPGKSIWDSEWGQARLEIERQTSDA